MQPGDGNALGGGGAAALPTTRPQVGVLTQGEGRDFEAVVADGTGEGALALETQLPHDFVAQRDPPVDTASASQGCR